MECVFLESPYSGDIDRNLRYVRFCKYDAWARGEFAYASHDDMTQHPAKTDFFVSDYDDKWTVFSRDGAIAGANSMRKICAKTVFYTDLGVSNGMKKAIEYCKDNELPYEERKIDIDKIMTLNASLVPREFIEAVINNKSYDEFLV